MRRQLGFANVPIALAVTAMTLVAVGAVVVLIRVLCETQWVEPSHSHGGMASSWRV
jgi:hypothetical protein